MLLSPHVKVMALFSDTFIATFSARFGETLSPARQDLNFKEKDFSLDNKTVNVQT